MAAGFCHAPPSVSYDEAVHRHTLEYRLKTIEDLVQADLSDPITRLLMQLALVLRRGAPATPPRRRARSRRTGP